MNETGPEKTVPCAVRLAYDGRMFHGSQVQPDVDTVESALRECLERAEIIRRGASIRLASRTDAGVSALCNVAVIDSAIPPEAVAPTANRRLENIWVTGVSPVSQDFNPRHARMRWYRYFLPRDGMDPALAQNAARAFTGTHDFSNFARVEEGKDPVRTLDSVEMSESGAFLLFDIKAPSFLWNMVRRIMGAVGSAALGNIGLPDIERALGAEETADLGLAPAENLVLMSISYDDLTFGKKAPPGVAKDVAKRLAAARLETAFFETFMDEM